MDELVGEYDLIVVDSAPLLAVPDTRLIVPIVDNFCLVVRAEYVPKGAVRHVISGSRRRWKHPQRYRLQRYRRKEAPDEPKL